MTKQEVRAAILAKLCVSSDDVLYDVGSGTGSVAVELALLAPKGTVYAFEQKQEACELIRENAKLFGVDNVRVVEGEAPESFDNLPAPQAAFVGGSGGKLPEILERLITLNPQVRICIACITLETLALAIDTVKGEKYPNYEVVQIGVSRSEKLNDYTLMKAQNPVYLVTIQGAVK